MYKRQAENEFDTDQKFSKEDIVVLTIGGTEIQSMAKAEIVEGTVSSVKDNDYVKLDGTTYNYNRAYCAKVINAEAGLVNLDDGENFINPDIDNEVVLYLDTYGNAVAIEGEMCIRDRMRATRASSWLESRMAPRSSWAVRQKPPWLARKAGMPGRQRSSTWQPRDRRTARMARSSGPFPSTATVTRRRAG